MTVLEKPCLPKFYVLVVEGPLRAPHAGELMGEVRGLLDRGERHIVVDLSQVSTIDAAGIGQLVCAYNEAVEADGVVQVVRAAAWVREVLQLVGLFDLLSARASES